MSVAGSQNMTRLGHTISKVSSAVFAVLGMWVFVGPATAAVPVEDKSDAQFESRSDRVQQARQSTTELGIPPTIEPTANTDRRSADAASEGSQLTELFYQVQMLQQEVQTLRGQIEEQDYLIQRLQKDQKEQYLDLDRRVAGMAAGQSNPVQGPSTPTNSAPDDRGSAMSRPLATNMTERDAYQTAFDAMKARQFDASKTGFKRLIEDYPNGQYTPNAYYWLGELYLVSDADSELARQAFMQVVSLYPDHSKTPDALYKLGVVYSTLGDKATALSYLQRVQQEHPATSAAGLAAKYAEALQ
jgi:tol-pal system protein YbgF